MKEILHRYGMRKKGGNVTQKKKQIIKNTKKWGEKLEKKLNLCVWLESFWIFGGSASLSLSARLVYVFYML
jgi:hypothetical protein